jgi:rhomboid protease GluP
MDSAVKYEPRRAYAATAGVFLTFMGLWMILRNHDVLVPLLIAGGCVLALAAFLLFGAARGLPRLTFTDDTVILATLFGTKWAEWNSLGPFETVSSYGGRRAVVRLQANITGSNVSPNLLKKKTFIISDSFASSLAAIADEARVRRLKVVGETELPPSAAAQEELGLSNFTAPWAAIAILIVLAAIFGAEQIFAVAGTGSPFGASIATTIALGGLNRQIMAATGEWYRIFTGPLLHANLAHITFNAIALVIAARSFEKFVGRRWFLATYAVGTVTGSLMSMAVNPINQTSVGASGAIMAVFAAMLVCSRRFASGSLPKARLQNAALQVLVPSLLPIVRTSSAGSIDYGAHLGGAIGGALVAFLMLKAWPKDARLPALREMASGVAGAGVICSALAMAAVAAHYPAYNNAYTLIPSPELPAKGVALTAERVQALTDKYPGDPRSHMYKALFLDKAKDYPAAETEMRSAIALTRSPMQIWPKDINDALAFLLAGILQEEGRMDEARQAAAPYCAPDSQSDESVRKMLDENALCKR